MKRFLVSATAAAVLSALSSGAFAVVNLDDGKTAANYASQLVVPAVTSLTGTGVNVTSTLGFGVSNGQTRFIRYDLTNAKFKATVVAGDLAVPTSTVVVSQGGGAGSTFVIFQITATANVAQDATVAFASGTGGSAGLVIQSAASGVQMSYSLYEDAPSAAAGGAAGRLSTAAATVAGVISGLAFSTVPNTTTVDVGAPSGSYTRFLFPTGAPAGTSTTVAQIGTVSIGAAPGVLDPVTGLPVTYPAIVGAGTALVLKGDFGTAAPSSTSTGVFLGVDGGNCGTAGTAPKPATPTDKASFTTGATPAAAKPLCFTLPAGNTKQVPAQSFTVEADITAAAGSTATDLAPINAGTFIRNGLVLKAAFAETTSASGVSSSVTLNNTSNNDAPYSVSCLVNSVGAKAGTPGTVKAHSSTRLSVSTGLGCPSDGTLRGVELTFAVTPGSVVGSVARQNTSTGQASFDSMTGNQ